MAAMPCLVDVICWRNRGLAHEARVGAAALRCALLRRLVLSAGGLDVGGVAAGRAVLDRLRHFSFTCAADGDAAAVAAVVRRSPNLRTFVASRPTAGRASFAPIILGLARCAALRRVDVSQSRALACVADLAAAMAHCTRLVRVDLTKSSAADADVPLVLNALARSKQLERLDFRDSHVTAAVVGMVADAVGWWPCLRQISVCHITGHAESRRVCAAFADHADANVVAVAICTYLGLEAQIVSVERRERLRLTAREARPSNQSAN
jgi:hypothetical protein